MKISGIAYQKYQLDRAIKQGFTFEDINAAAYDWFNERMSDPDDDTTFLDYVFEHGFGEGSLWTCYDKFFEGEYKDKEYMKSLLTKEEYEDYLREMLVEARVELTFSPEELVALGFLNQPCDEELLKRIHESVIQAVKLEKKEFKIETPIGQILVKEIPGPDYPGVSLEYVGGNGVSKCIMEYNPQEQIVQLRIYGKEEPGGDALAILCMSENAEDDYTEEMA